MNGLNRAGVVATDSIVLVPLAVGAWVEIESDVMELT